MLRAFFLHRPSLEIAFLKVKSYEWHEIYFLHTNITISSEILSIAHFMYTNFMTSPLSACSHAMCCPVYLTIWTLHPEVAKLDFVGIFSFHIFGPNSSAKDCFISILILLFRSLDQFLGQISILWESFHKFGPNSAAKY